MTSLPYPLATLALESLGQMVSDLLVRLALQPVIDEKALKQLGDVLEMHVPSNLANEVTDKLLSCILNTLDEIFLDGYLQRDGFCSYMQRCEELSIMALNVASCTIHPAVTVLDNYIDFDGFLPSMYMRKFFSGYVNLLLIKQNKLKILRLHEAQMDSEFILKGQVALQNLHEFCYHACSDEILLTLGGTCSGLQVLDVQRSEKVTNMSVDSILKFRQLHTLKIGGTRISAEGVSRILQGFSQSECTITKLNLKAFKSSFTRAQISLLPESFSNLIALEVFLSEKCSLTPLSQLKHLQILGLSCYPSELGPVFRFHQVQELLTQIGGQLLKLKIVNLTGTDLRTVGMTCPKIEKLTLTFLDTYFLGFPEDLTVAQYIEKYPLPEFSCIRCCDLRIRNCNLVEYLMLRMRGLKHLRLWWVYGVPDSLLKKLTTGLQEGSLEMLEIRQNVIRVFGTQTVLTDGNNIRKMLETKKLEEIVTSVFRGPASKCYALNLVPHSAMQNVNK